jgi:hypothetical protein
MTAHRDQRCLICLHARQVRLFDRGLASVRREYRREEKAQGFLALLERMSETLHEQVTSVATAAQLAGNLPRRADRSADFVREYSGIHAYNFLTAKRRLVEQIGILDREQPAFKAQMAFTDEAEPFQDDPKIWGAACENGWRMAACHWQVESLLRQAQAITETQEALMCASGLQFWLSHTGRLQWQRSGGA